MNLYEDHYTKLHFERAGLFKVVRDRYQCRDVLYPGCSVHITPSLYFPHVVYVDQSQAAARFFVDQTPLLEFVNRNKHYKQSTYIRFIQHDYSQPLPIMEVTFDLLLSLFAEGIASSCANYLKPGGLLLTNNHRGDALEAVKDHHLSLNAVIQFHKGKYVIVEEGTHGKHIPVQKSKSHYLKQVNQGMEYVEHELYYVFERSH